MLLACDLVLVAESARIGAPDTPFAVIPGGGSTVRLPRIVDASRALELFLTGRWLDAGECGKYGLAVQAVPNSELTSALERMTDSIADKPRDCLAALKRQLVAVDVLSVRDGLEVELTEFLAYVGAEGSPAREGFYAWREGRPRTWS